MQCCELADSTMCPLYIAERNKESRCQMFSAELNERSMAPNVEILFIGLHMYRLHKKNKNFNYNSKIQALRNRKVALPQLCNQSGTSK